MLEKLENLEIETEMDHPTIIQNKKNFIEEINQVELEDCFIPTIDSTLSVVFQFHNTGKKK